MLDWTSALDQKLVDKILKVLKEIGKTSDTELAEILGKNRFLIRRILKTMVAQELLLANHTSPVRYSIYKPIFTERVEKEKIEYKGERTPYIRPGSYTPPEKPRIPMLSKVPHFSNDNYY